jgi:Family of unknown function (DUF6781)
MARGNDNQEDAMAETTPEPVTNGAVTNEDLTQAATESVEQGTDIRSRVRDLTLQGLRERRLEPEQIKQVLRSMTEGIRRGAERRPHGVRGALSDALAGLDEALMKSAEAGSLALKELTTHGKDLSEHELKQALDSLNGLEESFFSTVHQAADSAGIKVKQEMLDLLSHARRSGTDTGAKVAATLGEFAGKMTHIGIDSAKLGFETARDFGARFALLASGILAGLADALHEQATHRNSKPAQSEQEKSNAKHALDIDRGTQRD